MAIHSKYLETLQAILGTALNIVKSRMLADLYVRREYTGDFRVRVKLDNGSDIRPPSGGRELFQAKPPWGRERRFCQVLGSV
jgi:hypothetical protein